MVGLAVRFKNLLVGFVDGVRFCFVVCTLPFWLALYLVAWCFGERFDDF